MRLLKKQSIEDILFFDIETARLEEKLTKDSPAYPSWKYDHLKNVDKEDDLIDLYKNTASLYAEYSKIICISVAAVRGNKIMVKSFNNSNEAELLQEFMDSLAKFSTNKTWLCGHNILGFDMPFVMKRSLINQVEMHPLIDTAHLKPWETSALDTFILWKGTGFKGQSLTSILYAMGLPTSKDDISGADVGRVYYEEEGGLERITKYCEKDVIQTVHLIQKLRYGEPLELAQAPIKTKPQGILDYVFNGGEWTPEVEEQLKEALSTLNKKDKKIAKEILNTLPSRAKGKETNITKAIIKNL